MRSFYFIRHGETEWNKERLFQGQTDIPLNDTGREQAKEIADQVLQIDNAKFFSSPLQRAYETAEIILAEKRAPIQVLPDLMETHSVEAATFLLTQKGVDPLPSFAKMGEDKETKEEYLARVRKALEYIFKNSMGHTPVIFSHGVVCTAICYLFDIPYFKTPNCSLIHFKLEGTSFTPKIL